MSQTRKVIVAVHGVGDQFQYATAQSVVNRFCGYYFENQPAAVPLGQLHREPRPVRAPRPPFDDKSPDLSFEEVYWAPVPRDPVKAGHILEEAKAWARTVTARVGTHAGGPRLTHGQFETIRTVLEEMVEAIAVLERLGFLAEKAGVLKFELGRVLVDFVGDVQIVTEFDEYREQILKRFDDVMTRISDAKGYEDADIYIVAHSEGTVIAFLGLLRAFRPKAGAAAPKWAGRVKGLMTLGSPIDKHVVLWPDLWAEFQGGPTTTPPAPIHWKNYYDNGDPIGFDLDIARNWIGDHGWDQVFQFTDKDDHGFTRYHLPGKAHVDYWTDPAVFGHFIANVVDPPGAAGPRPAARRYRKPPRSKFWAGITSYALPYLIAAALLFLACFVLYKTTHQALDPEGYQKVRGTVLTVFRKVGAMTMLLAGVTIAARVTFLTRLRTGLHFWLVGLLIFAACAIGYYELNVGEWLLKAKQVEMGGFPSSRSDKHGGRLAAAAVVAVATLIAVAGIVVGKVSPRWGRRALLILGAVAIAGVVTHLTRGLTDESEANDRPALWPVFFAAVAFLYLWWLVILIFDLTFIWHRYIRHSRALGYFADIRKKAKAQVVKARSLAHEKR
jgi:hypothetical protein